MYGTKYFSQIEDAVGNVYTVNINKQGYGGSSTEIIKYALNPLQYNIRGGRDAENQYIFPSEISFTFYVEEGEDYSDLFTSNYKDFQLEVLKNGNVFWIGWIKQDFFTRSFLKDSYYLNIVATDGLQDLQNIPVPSSAVGGFSSFISVFKALLSEIGFALDINCQVNIYEAAFMDVEDYLFSEVKLNTLRFRELKDGRASYISCYDALNHMLKVFNAELNQQDGKYRITQKNEVLSRLIKYDFSTLAIDETSTNNRVIDITDKQFTVNSDQLSFIPPAKRHEITFRNKNEGEVISTNLTADKWNNGTGTGRFEVFSEFGTNVEVGSPHPLTGGTPSNTHYVESDSFYLEKVSTGDTVTFSLSIIPIVMDADSPHDIYPFLRLRLIYPNGSFVDDYTQRIANSQQTYTNKKTWSITATGNYKIRIYIVPDSSESYNEYRFYLRDFQANSVFQHEVNFDKFYLSVNNDSTAIGTLEDEIFFGDTFYRSDLATLMIGNNLTYTWRIYSGIKESFTNGSFNGATSTPWSSTADGGVTWQYLIDEQAVRAFGTTYSRTYYQTDFKAGRYTISVTLKNENEILNGFSVNGYFAIRGRYKNTTDWISLSTSGITSGAGYVTRNFTVTLDDVADLGFYVFRVGQGSDLDMTVSSISVTSFAPQVSSKKLLPLLSFNRLKQSAAFKEYLQLTVHYNEIDFSNLLQIKDKKYFIVGLTADLMMCQLTLDLIEFLNDNTLNISPSEQSLTTIDGQSTSSGSAGSTIIIDGVSITEYNSFVSQVANTYLPEADFTVWSGSTLPNLYTRKTTFNTYTGTTAPNLFASKSLFNSFTGSTDNRLDYLESLTGSTNGVSTTLFNSFTGTTLPANYVTLGTAQTITGLKTFTNSSYPVIQSERTSTGTNTVLSAIALRHKTSADMVDGFGTNMVFEIMDSANVANQIGAILAKRAGADNSGSLVFQTITGGSINDAVTILPNGNLILANQLYISSTPTNDNAQTSILVRDSSNGQIKTRAASTFQPADADLTAISNFSTVGFAVRTNTDTWEQRTIIGGSYISVTNGNGVGGNVSISLNDAGLQSIAGLSTTSDQMLYTTASNVFATTSLTSFARSLLANTSSSAARTTLDAQQADADLTALAGLSSTGFAVRSGTNTWAQRSLANGSNISITNGNGAAGNPTITVTGLTIGTNVQAYDAGLTSIAGLTTASNQMIYTTGSDAYATTTLSAFARTILDDGDAATVRTTIGAQPLDATLTALAGLTTSADQFIYSTGSDSFSTATVTSFARTILDDGDAATVRTTIGAQPLDATLTALAGVTTSADKLIYATGSDTFTTATVTSFARTLLDDSDAATARATLGITSSDITQTAFLDFPSVAAGGTSEIDVTVTGAATTDTVVVNPGILSLGTLMFCAWISAANTVTIKIYNTSSSSSYNMNACNWYIRVTKAP